MRWYRIRDGHLAIHVPSVATLRESPDLVNTVLAGPFEPSEFLKVDLFCQ